MIQDVAAPLTSMLICSRSSIFLILRGSLTVTCICWIAWSFVGIFCCLVHTRTMARGTWLNKHTTFFVVLSIHVRVKQLSNSPFCLSLIFFYNSQGMRIVDILKKTYTVTYNFFFGYITQLAAGFTNRCGHVNLSRLYTFYKKFK